MKVILLTALIGLISMSGCCSNTAQKKEAISDPNMTTPPALTDTKRYSDNYNGELTPSQALMVDIMHWFFNPNN